MLWEVGLDDQISGAPLPNLVCKTRKRGEGGVGKGEGYGCPAVGFSRRWREVGFDDQISGWAPPP